MRFGDARLVFSYRVLGAFRSNMHVQSTEYKFTHLHRREDTFYVLRRRPARLPVPIIRCISVEVCMQNTKNEIFSSADMKSLLPAVSRIRRGKRANALRGSVYTLRIVT